MRLQLGYVPLCDAAPLIVAHAFGFARAEGLELDLSAEPSWATLRDRLALGHLDGAHMLAPLALASRLALSGPPSDLVVPLQLSANGNAVTVSRGLWAAMEPASETLADVARAKARVAAER
ncbi:ABC transporter substrate-binding protein, partial [Methylobacterium sp. WL18]|uniref:ABC transporter substrate-binding protein n=1 Tax=Methylobacterium sp. WL18 TaxID=2603897 RepID=UPI0011C9B786